MGSYIRRRLAIKFREVSGTMKTRALFATLLTLALSTASFSSFPQKFDKPKLNQFFDRLAERRWEAWSSSKKASTLRPRDRLQPDRRNGRSYSVGPRRLAVTRLVR